MNQTTSSSLDSNLQTFQIFIEHIKHIVYDIDSNLCMCPKIHRFRCDPIITEKCDSVKITFSRNNKHLSPNYPYIQFALTPFYFQIKVSCPSFSREKMDIIRSLAIAKTSLFEKAWSLLKCHPEIQLEGKTYSLVDVPGARFFAYPREISSFLEHRTTIFNFYDTETKDFSADQYIPKIDLFRPLYKLLLVATEYEGTNFLQDSIFDPWNIDKPEAVALAHQNYT